VPGTTGHGRPVRVNIRPVPGTTGHGRPVRVSRRPVPGAAEPGSAEHGGPDDAPDGGRPPAVPRLANGGKRLGLLGRVGALAGEREQAAGEQGDELKEQ
jgi:hypothetical protein